MKRVALVSCAVIGLSGMLACGVDDQVTQPEAGGSAAAGSGGGAAGGSNAQCNTLANDAPHVVPVHQPTAPPAALGGTISDGRYFQTGYTLFDGPNGQSTNLGDFWSSAVMLVANGTMQSIEGYRMEGLEHLPGTARTYTFVASGPTLSVTETCPKPQPAAMISFTATPAEFRYYVPAPGTVTELIFTKQ
ncbi:MAG: hypothetical protein ABJB12_14100 [Pseudomonadota bacterium]